MITTEKSFDLPEANVEEINKIIRSLNNNNKVTIPDGIAAKIEKPSANVKDIHSCNIINKVIFQNSTHKM